MEIVRLQVFDKTLLRISGFVTACKLYIRMKMREAIVEDLEGRLLEYETVKEFLTDIKNEFEGKDEEEVKVAELKRLEQGSKTIKEFVQEFKRVVSQISYLLVVMLELNGVSEVQYKEIIIIGDE